MQAHRQIVDKAIIIIVSGEVWLLSGLLNDRVMSFAHVAPGIDLIFLPAALRIGLVLVFGVWGAIGIACFDPILFVNEFGWRPPGRMALTAITVGFVPLLTVMACRRLLGIGPGLRELRFVHLPVIALATAITTPLALNIEFLFENIGDPAQLFSHLSAMILGDFLACALVLIAIRLAMMLRERAQRDRLM